MTAADGWGREREVEITAELIAEYAAAVGERPQAFDRGAAAPPMFAVVYSAPAVWETVIATVNGPGPLIHAAQEFEWHAPVHAGDRIATRARLDREDTAGGHPSFRFRSISHRGNDLVCEGRWTILAPEGSL